MAKTLTAIWDRPSVAVSSLLTRNPGAAARAFFDPESLSPTEKKDWAEKHFGERGLLATIASMVTNPVVLLGIVMAARWPVGSLKYLRSYAANMGGLERKWTPFLRHFQSLHELFRGVRLPGRRAKWGTLPEVFDEIIYGTEKFGNKYMEQINTAIEKFQRTSGRTFDYSTQIKIAMHQNGMAADSHAFWRYLGQSRSGLAPLTRPEREFLESSRKAFSDMFDEAVPNKKVARLLIQHLRNQNVVIGDDIKKLKDYWPHLRPRSSIQFEEQARALVEGGGGDIGATRGITEAGQFRQASRQLGKRLDLMMPNFRELQQTTGVMSPTALQRYARRLSADAKIGKVLPQYSVAYLPVLRSYLPAMARSYGFVTTGAGPKFREFIRYVDEVAPMKSPLLKDSFLPIATGKLPMTQAMAALEWGGVKQKVLDTLGRPWAKKALGAKMVKSLKAMILDDHGMLSWQNVGGKISSYFYLSTLGINPVSAFNNLLQTLLTTYPILGGRATLYGIRRAKTKAAKYFGMRAAGVTEKIAFEKVFPYAEEIGINLQGGHTALRSALNDAWISGAMGARIGVGKFRGVADKAKNAMMSLFTQSERFNRIVAYEGAMWKGQAEGMSAALAHREAISVVEMGHFLSGPSHTPTVFMKWWPPLRQFTQFQTRYASFLAGAAPALSTGDPALMNKLIFGRQFGTVGRGLAGSAIAYEVGKGLFGADLSHALMFGALPEVQEGRAFAPYPFVPPFLSLLGGLGTGLGAGEWEQFQRAAPTLIPGGVAAARFLPAVPGSEQAAKLLHKSYADYSHRTEDGRIPVYSYKGSLEGYYTPTQVFMRGVGIPFGQGPRNAEVELNHYLLKQRDRLRAHRRAYADAMNSNDVPKMQELSRLWERAYPELGPLQLKQSDIRSLHLRREIPRLERLLETLPVESREEFADVIRAALANQAGGLLQINPEALGRTSIAQRHGPTPKTLGHSPNVSDLNLGPGSNAGQAGGVRSPNLPQTGGLRGGP